MDCGHRCEDSNPLCTAATAPYLDLDTHYGDSIFSPDPQLNPAFHDYNIGECVVCSVQPECKCYEDDIQRTCRTAAATGSPGPRMRAS